MLGLAAALQYVVDALLYIRGLGVVGRCVYIVLLSAWTVLCLPTTPVELAAGYIFPWASAASMSVAGKTIGSMAALWLGRHLLRPLAARVFSGSGRAAGRLRRHLLNELRARPIQTIGLLRASPLPTPIKLYGLSLLPVELVP